jgi:hypothetical protein
MIRVIFKPDVVVTDIVREVSIRLEKSRSSVGLTANVCGLTSE